MISIANQSIHPESPLIEHYKINKNGLNHNGDVPENSEQVVPKTKKNVRQKTSDGQIIYMLGERGSGTRARSQIQDFHTIQNECLESSILFEDPDFPCDDSSLLCLNKSDRDIKWLRPMEIIENPQFFVEGFSRFDVKQGELEDCWFIAATANLTMNQRLFGRVVPEDQTFDKNYAGVFHFHFWQYGKWVDVVIDDRLPTVDRKLIYMHSHEPTEFWSALFEKAYAKLHGSYNALNLGTTMEAMVDFTGGITELIELEDAKFNLFNILMKALERNSMIGCSIESNSSKQNVVEREGLITDHSYSINKVKWMDTKDGILQMVRLRNPWGTKEWNGAWSDRSTEWNSILEPERKEIGLEFENDGEFWMAFHDFQQRFTDIEICNLSPRSLSDEKIIHNRKKFDISSFEGQWRKGVTAGGSSKNSDTFWRNPQYKISLENPEDTDDKDCTMICTMLQKNRRRCQNDGNMYINIGFTIYPAKDEDLVNKPLTKDFFVSNTKEAKECFADNKKKGICKETYSNMYQVTKRLKLSPGNYIIVPSTEEHDVDGEFLIRVFAECKSKMEENDETIGFIQPTQSLGKSKENLNDPKSKAFERLFDKVSGVDREVDWMELKGILDSSMKYLLSSENTRGNGAFGKVWQWIRDKSCFSGGTEEHTFSKDICRSMVAMMDVDKSGKLGLEEFRSLMDGIENWSKVFKEYDKDNSGSFDSYELREALNAIGFTFNYRVLNALYHRYGSRDGKVYFEDFLMCAIKLKTLLEYFERRDIEGVNLVSFNKVEWIENTIYS